MKNKLDMLKAIAILLVVLGHVTNHYMVALPTKVITITVYLFHMSLFVAISGAVFELGCKKGKYTEFSPFIINKVKRLLVPFAFTALFVLAPTLVFWGKTGMGYWGTVADIFKGGGLVKHLWYLQALFWIFLAAWVLVHFKVNRYAAFIGSLVLAVSVSCFNANRYLSLGMAVNKFPLFILGMILMNAKCGCRQIVGWTVSCLVFGTAQIVFKDSLADTVSALLFSVSIVGLLFSLADYAYIHVEKSIVLSFLVKYSFGIYLFHMTPIYLIRYLGCDTWPQWLSVPVTFVFALCVSILLTMLVRTCRLQLVIGEK